MAPTQDSYCVLDSPPVKVIWGTRLIFLSHLIPSLNHLAYWVFFFLQRFQTCCFQDEAGYHGGKSRTYFFLFLLLESNTHWKRWSNLKHDSRDKAVGSPPLTPSSIYNPLSSLYAISQTGNVCMHVFPTRATASNEEDCRTEWSPSVDWGVLRLQFENKL